MKKIHHEKTILKAIRDCVFPEIKTESGIYIGRSSIAEYTPAWIEAINAAAGEMVRQYCDEGEIRLGPVEGSITLGDVPPDVLPFIPLMFDEISEYGTYSVYQYGKYIGEVIYNGWPKQDMPGIPIIGVSTNFMFASKNESFEQELRQCLTADCVDGGGTG